MRLATVFRFGIVRRSYAHDDTMTLDELRDQHPEALLMDGFDDCIAGIVTRCSAEPIVCYDTDRVIAKLMSQGLSREEAIEFHEFNQAGAWLGDGTPCFLERVE